MILLQHNYIDTFITAIAKDDVLATTVDSVTNQLSVIALGIAIFLAALMIGYNYVRKTIDNATSGNEMDGALVDIKELVRIIIIILLIIMYPNAIQPAINGVVMGINKLTAPSTDQIKKMADLSFQKYEAAAQEQLAKQKAELKEIIENNDRDPNGNLIVSQERKNEAQQELNNIEEQESAGGFSLTTIAESISSYIFGRISMNFQSVLASGGGVIKTLIGVLAILIFKVLLCFGPMALAVSVIPMMKNQADTWFGTTLGAGMALTTINIIDHIVYTIYEVTVLQSNSGSFEAEQISYTIISSLSIMIMYLMSFWLTSKWIGKGDAGRFVTKAITLAAMAATMGGAAAAAKAKGGSNMFSNITNAVQNSQKTTNKLTDEGEE